MSIKWHQHKTESQNNNNQLQGLLKINMVHIIQNIEETNLVIQINQNKIVRNHIRPLHKGQEDWIIYQEIDLTNNIWL